jgi:flagellar hook-length control protein FliK
MQIVPWARAGCGTGRTLTRQWTAAGDPSAEPWSLTEPQQLQREQARRAVDERERRVEEHGAEIVARPTPADVIRESERSLDPSSRAFRGEAARADLRDRLRNAPTAFRDALAQSRQIACESPPQPSGAAAATGSATDRASSSTRVDAEHTLSGSSGAPPRPGTSPRTVVTLASGQNHPPAPAGNLMQPDATSSDAGVPIGTPALTPSSTAGPVSPAAGIPSAPGTANAPAAPANDAGANGARAAPSTNVVAPDVRASPLRTASARLLPPAGEGAESAQARANVERVLRVIRSHAAAGRSSATIRLDPPELGTLRLRMELEQDALRLRIETQSVVAHRLLSDELDSLRRGLEAAGLHLERVEIRPPAPPDAEHWAPSHEQSEPQGGGQPGGAETDGSTGSGTESGTSASAADSPPGAEDDPAAEPRVNVLA